jgi:putative endonuclease
MYVYILANRTRVLYVGVTSDLKARVFQHKDHLVRGFTQRYNVDELVYFETYGDPIVAIEREKRIKRMTRAKKVRLIERENSAWLDLSDNLYAEQNQLPWRGSDPSKRRATLRLPFSVSGDRRKSHTPRPPDPYCGPPERQTTFRPDSPRGSTTCARHSR